MSTGLNGKVTMGQAHSDQLVLGNVSLGPADIMLSGSSSSETPFDGLLATGALGFSQIAFDFTHGTFSWQVAQHRASSRPAASTALQSSTPLSQGAPTPGGTLRNCSSLANTLGRCRDVVLVPQTR